jgi:hypothetical protein
MGVRKFASIEDMKAARWLPEGSGEIVRRLRFVCGVASAFRPPVPRGVHRFRSIEEADAARDAWERTPVPLP